jgi:hypothetical protein
MKGWQDNVIEPREETVEEDILEKVKILKKEAECKYDLACVVAMLLKACPILRKSLPHAYWLEYLHTARYTVRKLNSKEHDTVTRITGCSTVEEAIKKAES